MRNSALALTAIIGLAIASPAIAQATGPTDTGNMAYPAPLPSGTTSTTRTEGRRAPTDTGNMAYPAPLSSGLIGTTRTEAPRAPTDTGNMAYPNPVVRGNIPAK